MKMIIKLPILNYLFDLLVYILIRLDLTIF